MKVNSRKDKMQRCVRPKRAAHLLGALFLDPEKGEIDPGLDNKGYCIVAITTPFLLYASVAAPAGVAVIAAFISFILCCMKPARTTPK